MERHKVAYTVRADRARLANLGDLCVQVNPEVLDTSIVGADVILTLRFPPEYEGAVSESLGSPAYLSPRRIVKGVSVPLFDSAAQEIEARLARMANRP